MSPGPQAVEAMAGGGLLAGLVETTSAVNGPRLNKVASWSLEVAGASELPMGSSLAPSDPHHGLRGHGKEKVVISILTGGST